MSDVDSVCMRMCEEHVCVRVMWMCVHYHYTIMLIRAVWDLLTEPKELYLLSYVILFPG